MGESGDAKARSRPAVDEEQVTESCSTAYQTPPPLPAGRGAAEMVPLSRTDMLYMHNVSIGETAQCQWAFFYWKWKKRSHKWFGRISGLSDIAVPEINKVR